MHRGPALPHRAGRVLRCQAMACFVYLPSLRSRRWESPAPSRPATGPSHHEATLYRRRSPSWTCRAFRCRDLWRGKAALAVRDARLEASVQHTARGGGRCYHSLPEALHHRTAAISLLPAPVPVPMPCAAREARPARLACAEVLPLLSSASFGRFLDAIPLRCVSVGITSQFSGALEQSRQRGWLVARWVDSLSLQVTLGLGSLRQTQEDVGT